MSSTPVSSILRAALEDREKLNVLCFFLDGRFEQELIDTGHNIYGCKQSFLAISADPAGLKYIPASTSQIDPDILFDLVLFNHMEIQAEKAAKLSKLFHIPMLGIQHFLPASHLKYTKDLVCIDESIRDKFNDGCGEVIHYGVKDTGESTSARDIDVLIHGTFLPKDFSILHHISEMQFKVEIHGNNPGFSHDIDYKTLTEKLKRTKIFINLSTHTGVPYSALIAMMNGCAILTNKNEITPHIFNDKCSIVAENLSSFSPCINKMLQGNWEEMGQAARAFALEKHDYNKSVSLWKQKIESKAKEIFVL